jgi:polyketide cyclase/dehydrase/lipid transport protein
MLKIGFISLISFSLAAFGCAEKPNHKGISMTFIAKHISVSINRSAAQVYEFASIPENLPKWAAGLSGSIKKLDEDWVAESPMGRVKVKFAEKNQFGVLDHEVTLPSGVKVHNPMRVVPNNDGSELVFSLYRRPNMSDQEFAEDAKSVEKDLAKLKTLLEK